MDNKMITVSHEYLDKQTISGHYLVINIQGKEFRININDRGNLQINKKDFEGKDVISISPVSSNVIEIF